jgi:hypothetical protein
MSPVESPPVIATSWRSLPPWLPVHLPAAHKKDLPTIIAALDPAGALRYQPRDGTTFCNIFCWDVSLNAGVEVPHWYELTTGAAREVGRGIEMHANRMVEWLKVHWVQTPLELALKAAAQGFLVINGWRNPEGIGHVSILLPSGNTAQAGRTNFANKPLAAGFGRLPVRHFVSPTAPFKSTP